MHWRPTPVLLPGESHGWRSLVGCSPWGCEESDTTEWLHFHFSLSRIGEGNGNPLQCSCLQNPRGGGAWWAAVYGVAQSRTWLTQLSSSSKLGWFREFWKHLYYWKMSLLSQLLSHSYCCIISKVLKLKSTERASEKDRRKEGQRGGARKWEKRKIDFKTFNLPWINKEEIKSFHQSLHRRFWLLSVLLSYFKKENTKLAHGRDFISL